MVSHWVSRPEARLGVEAVSLWNKVLRDDYGAGSFLSEGASIPGTNIITISTNELFNARLWVLLVAPIGVASYKHM
jgi:hypothetical protein